MSPCFTQAKITWAAPVYATQSTDQGTVRARYFPKVFLAALVAFNLALLSPLASASYHTCQSHRENWGYITKNPHLSQEEPPKISAAYPQSLHGCAVNMLKLIQV